MHEDVSESLFIVFEKAGRFFAHGVATFGMPSIRGAEGWEPAYGYPSNGANHILVEVTEVEFEAFGFAPDFAGFVLAEVGEVGGFDTISVGEADACVSPLVVFAVVGLIIHLDVGGFGALVVFLQGDA